MAARKPFQRLTSIRTKIFFILLGTGVLGLAVLAAPHFFLDKPEWGPGILFQLEALARGPASLEDGAFILAGIQLCTIATVLFLAHWLISLVLRPIAVLHEGVEQIGEGHWDYRMKLHRWDELGALAAGFNSLAGKVKSTVEAKEHVLVEVSHELAKPLEAAKGIVRSIPADDAMAELAERLAEMEVMVERLIEAAKLHTLNGGIVRTTSDLVEITKDVVAGFQSRGLMLAIVENPPKVMARVDVTRYRILVTNLLENALRHSPKDKGVTVALSLQPQRVRLEVRDEGEGIPPEELTKVFEAFYRSPSARKEREDGFAEVRQGFGLGLSLCRQVVLAHGGTISLESTVGRGTSAIVLLPL